MMVVLSDDGKPVTVIRALDDDDDVISRGQRSPSAKSLSAGARVSADVKRNSANRYQSRHYHHHRHQNNNSNSVINGSQILLKGQIS